MQTIRYPEENQWHNWLKRPTTDPKALQTLVDSIFEDIRKRGDEAVRHYSRLFDQSEMTEYAIRRSTVLEALAQVPEDLKEAIQVAKKNIEAFHKEQKDEIRVVETTPGVYCWRESRPIERVGLYIPGGSAPLFSTVLMLGIPAKLAGCHEIILCTPPGPHPAILYAADLVGIRQIYAIGGIQAIAAMALGTETLPRTDKIFGPGNPYVTAAKLTAQQWGIAIDMPAGPSEVLIIADHSANPAFVAADLLAQAEHGPDSQVMLVSTDADIMQKAEVELEKQLKTLPRENIARAALQNSRAILLSSVDDCIRFSNAYAPEHLILVVENPENYTSRILNAGSVFLGPYSCESAGDYASGTNHTLPTGGFARSYSGVSLDSFVKKITFQELSREGLQRLGPSIAIMAQAEQLTGHQRAVTLRIEKP